MAEYDPQHGRVPPSESGLSAAQRDADEADLYAGLSGVAGIVASAHGLDDLLGVVAEFAAQAIPGVDGASVVIVEFGDDGAYSVRKHCATADFVQTIDVVQCDELHEGPCITCMHSRRPTVSGSLGSDKRWPHFGGRVARMDVHSALSLPLVAASRVIGAINTYAGSRDAFGEHAVRLGAQFAGPAAVSVYNAQLLAMARDKAEQLQQALLSRASIDQAIGIIRSRSGATAQEAFDRLVHISQSENLKLRVVAERLVEEAVRRTHPAHREP